MNLYYSPSYVASRYAFDTTRKSKWIADSLDDDPMDGIELAEPEPLTSRQLRRVHAAEYVQAVRAGEPRGLAESQGFQWDDGLWEMVRASNGGVVAAALDALANGVSGSLSSGLHHARRERGSGLCTFNGLAIAARAVSADGAKNVLILDLDAHCGGGTESLIAEHLNIWQCDISTNRLDGYTESDGVCLSVATSAGEYLPTVERRLSELNETAPHFDLCLYNAGMDPHENCDTGGMPGITAEMLAEREQMVFEWCRRQGTPVAFALAGGYTGAKLDQRQLVRLHRLTLEAAVAQRG